MSNTVVPCWCAVAASWVRRVSDTRSVRRWLAMGADLSGERMCLTDNTPPPWTTQGCCPSGRADRGRGPDASAHGSASLRRWTPLLPAGRATGMSDACPTPVPCPLAAHPLAPPSRSLAPPSCHQELPHPPGATPRESPLRTPQIHRCKTSRVDGTLQEASPRVAGHVRARRPYRRRAGMPGSTFLLVVLLVTVWLPGCS